MLREGKGYRNSLYGNYSVLFAKIFCKSISALKVSLLIKKNK